MAEQITVETQERAGVLVRATDDAGMEHRWWFDETDAGRLVLCAEVVEYDEDKHKSWVVQGRHYVPYDDMDVPPRVRDALAESGYGDGDLFKLDGDTVRKL